MTAQKGRDILVDANAVFSIGLLNCKHFMKLTWEKVKKKTQLYLLSLQPNNKCQWIELNKYLSL